MQFRFFRNFDERRNFWLPIIIGGISGVVQAVKTAAPPAIIAGLTIPGWVIGAIIGLIGGVLSAGFLLALSRCCWAESPVENQAAQQRSR